MLRSMALAAGAPGLAEVRGRLGPRVDAALERAADIALRLESETVSLEHLLMALIEDQDCALVGLVEHAFADPETIAADLLAIAPGILLVGREAILPFSPGALRALRKARRGAHEDRSSRVTTARLVVAAHAELPNPARARLEAAGFALSPWIERVSAEGRTDAPGGASAPVALEGHLFHSFDDEARRAVVGAAHAAHAAAEDSISPARLFLAAVRTGPSSGDRGGPSPIRLESALAGWTVDDEPPPARELAPDAELLAFLTALPSPASSLDVLERVLSDAASERASIFLRQKVGPELLAGSREALEVRG